MTYPTSLPGGITPALAFSAHGFRQGLPGPDDIHRRRLSNGLVFLYLHRPRLPFTALEAWLPAGAKYDGRGREGLAALTAGLLTRGTDKMSARRLYEMIDDLGMELSSGAGVDGARVSMQVLTEDLQQGLDLMGQVVMTPAFADDEVERMRREALGRLAEAEDDTGYLADRALLEQVFGEGHPYGHPSSGFPETVTGISPADIKEFHRLRYGPDGAVLAAVGSLEFSRISEMVESALGSWQGGADGASGGEPRSEPASNWGRAADNVEGPSGDGPAGAPGPGAVTAPAEGLWLTVQGKTQSDLAFGHGAIQRGHPDYYAFQILNLILGRMGLGGRIGKNVRDRQGLAYYAFSSLSSYLDGGLWKVRAGVAPENVHRAVQTITEEIRGICQDGVTDEELADAKSFLLGSLPLQMERAGGLVSVMLSMEIHGLGRDYLVQYPDIIQSLTKEQLQAAARDHLHPDDASLVVAGPPAASVSGVVSGSGESPAAPVPAEG